MIKENPEPGLNLRYIALLMVILSALSLGGCVLVLGRRSAVALQPDQEFTRGDRLSALVNMGHRYYCQTYVAGRDGFLAAVSIDISAARFRRAAYDRSSKRYRPVPPECVQPYNLAVVIYLVEGKSMGNKVIEFSIPCDEAGLDSVIVLPDKVKQTQGQKYALCAYYPDAPKEGEGQEYGAWTGDIKSENPDEQVVSGSDGIHWDFNNFSKNSLHFRTYTVRDCTTQGKYPLSYEP